MLNLLHHHFYQTVAFIRLYRTLSIVIALFLIFFPIFWTQRSYHDRFFPNVFIDNVDVSGKTIVEAKEMLAQAHQPDEATHITLSVESIQVSSSAAQLGLERQTDQALNQAFAEGHTHFFSGGILRGLKLSPPARFTTQATFDPALLSAFITTLKQKTDNPGQEPAATLSTSGAAASIKIIAGKPGRLIDDPKTQEQIIKQWNGKDLEVPAVVTSTAETLTEPQIAAAHERAGKYVGKEIVWKADRITHTLNDQELIKLLAFPEGYSESDISELFNLWAKQIDRPVQEPEFEYDEKTSTVKKFTAPRKGLKLNREETKQKLTEILKAFETPDSKESKEKSVPLQLPVQETEPTKKLSDLNSFGIKELIGFGESEYHHSIPTRIHNVALTAKNIDNTLVQPGQEFSFNKEVGDVSHETGYQPAYVIKDGRTVLGDGGGVCQVSSTLFRALLNAGLLVTKRKPHSYRVSYYELNSKPGFDATVYSGDVDLRFVNDTGHPLLISTHTDSDKLYMYVEIYGVSDGRTTEIQDYKMWDFVSAPPAQYVDDQTIPRGSIKQIDFAASGIKASFKNVVKDASGKVVRTDEYKSNYIPWRAVFLRGV